MRVRTLSVTELVSVEWAAEDLPYTYRTVTEWPKAEWEAMTQEQREEWQKSLFNEWKQQVQGIK